MKYPVFEPEFGDAEITAVADAMRRGEISGVFGRAIPDFEAAFAGYCGVEHGVAVANGTVALQLAARVAGVGPGDEVLVSASTNIASALAAYHNGAVTVPVDSEDKTWNLDISLLEQLISPKTKAIVVVHLLGNPVNMPAVMAIAKKHNLVVIEDCAEAHGAEWKGQKIGSFGHMACFSFLSNKIITTGEGGMVVTNDPNYAEQMREFRSHGITRNPDRMTTPTHGPWHYQMRSLGFNYRMTDISAALGLSQLGRLNEFIQRRRSIAQHYDEHFSSNDKIGRQAVPEYTRSARHLYVVRVPEARHLEVFEALRAKGIGVNLHYIPIHLQPFYEAKGFKAGDFPQAERYYREAISLPIFPGLSPNEQGLVIDTLLDAVG